MFVTLHKVVETNALRNQGKRQSNKILEFVVFFLDGQCMYNNKLYILTQSRGFGERQSYSICCFVIFVHFHSLFPNKI